MSSPIKTVLVYHATGKQGTAVVRALSAAGFSVRAAVRDINTDKATALAALPGVELVLVDLFDISTLTKAATGADAVFAYTFISADEIAHGIQMCEASKAAGSVRLHIWSSLESVSEATKGEVEFPAFDNKAKVAKYIANSGVKFVNLILGGFLENFIEFPGQAVYDATSDTISIQPSCLKKDIKVPFVWVKKDVGNAASVILAHPQEFTNTTIGLGDHRLSTVEVATIVQSVSGKKTVAVEDVEFGKAFGLAPLAQWCNDPKYGRGRDIGAPNDLLRKCGFKPAPIEEWVKEDLLPYLKL